MATNGRWIPDAPIPNAGSWAAIGGVPAALVGAALLLGIALVVSILVARKPDRLTILVGVSVLALAFFVVPTRVHERYLFPLFGLAGILLAFSWRWRIAYAIAGVATFLNMYVVLDHALPGQPADPGLARHRRSHPLLAGCGDHRHCEHGGAGLGIAQLRGSARRTLAAELAYGATEDEPAVTEDTPLVLHPVPEPDPGTARRGIDAPEAAAPSPR